MDFDTTLGRKRYWPGSNTPLSEEELASQFRRGQYWRSFGNAVTEDLLRSGASFAEGLSGAALVSGADYYRKKRQREADPADVLRVDNMAYGKRRRFAGVTAPADHNGGGTHQYTRSAYKVGQRYRASTSKIVRTEKKQLIYRVHAVNQYSTDKGVNSIINYRNTTAGNLETYFPHWVCDLTSCINRSGGVTRFGGTWYRPKYGETLQQLTWEPMRSSTAGGVNQTNYSWNIEHNEPDVDTNSNAFAAVVPGERSILEWADIRLMLYGATTSTTKFEVSLIQFTDEDFNPQVEYPIVVTTAATNPTGAVWTDAHGIQCYQEWMRPYMFNPIFPGSDIRNKTIIKYLSRKIITLSPTLTTHRDNTPSTHEFKMFWRPNRLCNYGYDENTAPPMSGAAMIDDQLNIVDDSIRAYVTPKARVFLSIRALVPPSSGTTVPDEISGTAGLQATFDSCIRVKHTTM